MLPLVALTLLPALLSAAQQTPTSIFLRDVRLAPGDDAPRVSILIERGRITKVGGPDDAGPVEARVLDGAGGLALPAFLDAYSFAGLATPEPAADKDRAPDVAMDVLVDMRIANRKGVQPAFRAAQFFAPEKDALEPWRESGFGALLAAPHGQILSGQSALFVTRDCAVRDALVKPAVYDHAGFEATGRGYPGTTMGAIAQLRQFFLDARWHMARTAREAEGRATTRTPFDADLEAVRPALAGERRVCCEAQTVGDVDRWLAVADENELAVLIAGGRDAWKRAPLLAERDVAVILTLEWDEEPTDPDDAKSKKKKREVDADDVPWTFEKPETEQRADHALWAEQRDSARRLSEAGVPIAFGTGKEKPKVLLERVRKLVKAGLAHDAALRALTAGAAEVLGVEGSLGSIEAGKDATFAVWTADPLTDEDARVSWLFVDGHATDLRKKAKEREKGPAEGLDAKGTWTLRFEGTGVPDARATLKMEGDGRVEGKVRGATPSGSEVELDVTGRLRRKTLALDGATKVDGEDATFSYSGVLEGDAWTGNVTWKIGGQNGAFAFAAQREPEEARR